MVNKWFISDTHFNHQNILGFMVSDGSLLRPQFKDVEEMNEIIIDNWNKTVAPYDKVYHLGDVCFGNVAGMQKIIRRLNGHKRLIIGNHDMFDTIDYLRDKTDNLKLFECVLSAKQFGDVSYPFIASHYPIQRDSLQSKKGEVYNVHGHTHGNIVKLGPIPDPRYLNICVEKTNYTPIHMDEIQKKLRG